MPPEQSGPSFIHVCARSSAGMCEVQWVHAALLLSWCLGPAEKALAGVRSCSGGVIGVSSLWWTFPALLCNVCVRWMGGLSAPLSSDREQPSCSPAVTCVWMRVFFHSFLSTPLLSDGFYNPALRSAGVSRQWELDWVWFRVTKRHSFAPDM